MSQKQVLIPLQEIDDIITALEWVMNKVDFECDCDPAYEWDTNAWNHKDSCASLMEDHTEIILANMRMLKKAAKATHCQLCGEKADLLKWTGQKLACEVCWSEAKV